MSEINADDYTTFGKYETEERTESKHGKSANPCFLCGRQVTGSLLVHYTTKGKLTDEWDETKVPDSQGCFPVGPECAKTLPKGFVFDSEKNKVI
jgi:hypothetical protein